MVRLVEPSFEDLQSQGWTFATPQYVPFEKVGIVMTRGEYEGRFYVHATSDAPDELLLICRGLSKAVDTIEVFGNG